MIEHNLKPNHEEVTYESILGSLPEGVMLVDENGVVIVCNSSALGLVGAKASDVIGTRYEEIVNKFYSTGGVVYDEGEVEIGIEDHSVIKTFKTGLPVKDALFAIEHKNSGKIWLRVNSMKLLQPSKSELNGAIVVTMRNVTAEHTSKEQLKTALRALERDKEFLKVLLDNLQEGIVAVDAEGRFTLFNPASLKFHGITDPEKMYGRVPTASDLYEVDGKKLERDDNPLIRALMGEYVKDQPLVIKHKDVEDREILATSQALKDKDDELIGAVVAMYDVTERNSYERKLAELALKDGLTKIGNRLKFNEDIANYMEVSNRHGVKLALFVIDLDNFKYVNDKYGHLVGDELLIEVGDRLKSAVRPEDSIARLGGDEFVVLCLLDGNDEELVRARILSALTDDIEIKGCPVSLRASIGLGIKEPGTVIGRDDLIKAADIDMYKIKANKITQ